MSVLYRAIPSPLTTLIDYPAALCASNDADGWKKRSAAASLIRVTLRTAIAAGAVIALTKFSLSAEVIVFGGFLGGSLLVSTPATLLAIGAFAIKTGVVALQTFMAAGTYFNLLAAGGLFAGGYFIIHNYYSKMPWTDELGRGYIDDNVFQPFSRWLAAKMHPFPQPKKS